MTDGSAMRSARGCVTQLFCQAAGALGRRLEPVTCGVPWPEGVVKDVSHLHLCTAAGEVVALQARLLDRWADGSIRWALLDWLAETNRDGSASYQVGVLEDAKAPASIAPAPLRAAERDGRVTVDTGIARFALAVRGRFPFESAMVADAPAIDPNRTALRVETEDGRRYEPAIDRVAIEEAGPIRVTVRVEGRLVGPGAGPLCEMTAFMSFFAASATVRFSLTLRNPRKAGHPGGCWDLGSGGSIHIRDASLTVALSAAQDEARIRFSPEVGLAYEDAAGDLEIYQDSSGGENWRSTNHIDRHRQVSNSFRGYRVRVGGQERSGLRATPAVCLESGPRFLGVAMPCFWQNFPKAVEASRGEIVLRMFPRQCAAAHEIQGGEQKTHCFFVALARDGVTEGPLDWCRRPMLAGARPEWYTETRAIPYLAPKADDPDDPYQTVVDAAIEGQDTFQRKREAIDEYGWRHFGDIYADHEAVFEKGPAPLVSHYNNQYDAVQGFALQFLRSGDGRWWKQMAELAAHVIDIDLYHTDRDKSAYNHGMFWHTCHYVDADTSTHRTYPAARNVCGGGPNAGHLYTSGLLLHYFLTGDALAREAVIELGRYVIDADDGRRTIFRWLDRGFTGVVTESAPGYHGPGRAPGNSINALLDAHRLTGDAAFLAKAEQLIRRCIHPADDLEARKLLNAETRWFYTLFLQALGKYLDHKAQLGRLDEMYAYGRESLLHYACWMTEHEYPYLDKPEILEYPTETWAAQDMRKSEVFHFAARYASAPAERERFRERGDFFFRASVATLMKMETRTLARPVVLLLSNGLMHEYAKAHPDEAAPPPSVQPADFGRPAAFVSQKARAKKRVMQLACVGACAVLVAAFLIYLFAT